MIKERTAKLRDFMDRHNISVYVIPTSDAHDSEYICDYYKCRRYMSGFTGSAGTMVVTKTEAVLFTDGRYFLQAEKQLEGSDIRLMKMGEPGVPDEQEYIIDNLLDNTNIGVDGRTISASYGLSLKKASANKGGRLIYREDLVGEIWKDRPSQEFTSPFVLEDKYAGVKVTDKLRVVREHLKDKRADAFLLTSLDDIAWLFNIRGNDIEYNPVVTAFSIVTDKEAILFARKQVFGESIISKLQSDEVSIMEYEDIYEYVKHFPATMSIILDRSRVNYLVYRNIEHDAYIIDESNYTTMLKAVKNEVEINNLYKAHLLDGIAVTRFMHWLKENVGKIKITEISAANRLEEFRKEASTYIEPSFETISAFNQNGAIVHYAPTVESDTEVNMNGLLLVDSGAQYYEGTTDITRTFVVGDITEQMKKHFTLLAKSMLNLAHASFLYGCSGQTLDVLAREPLWRYGLDYKHGTGHGVGYLLNVHEGPNNFRWKIREENDMIPLEPGMITTDEPGLYIEGQYGIRTENELLCVKKDANEYGTFLGFDILTCVPIDIDGIDLAYLNSHDIDRLNSYHENVYNKLAPFLDESDKSWLKNYTKKLKCLY